MSKRSRKRRQSSKAEANNYKIFRRTAIATAITVAVAPVEIAAGTWRTEHWGRNVEMFVVPTTVDRSLFGARLLEPLFGNANSLSYADLRFIYDPTHTEEVNLGFGHRRYLGRDWLLGAYFSFDTRETERDKRHNQLTFGAEALSVRWDANFNYYLPISSEKVVGLGTSGGVFEGNRFFANGVVEEALEGFDVEVGALLPFITIGETRLYLGGYHFDGEVAPDTGAGVKVRLEFRPRKDMHFGVTVQHDDLFQTEAMFNIFYSFGYAQESGIRTLNERMIQFHERDIDIKDTSPVDDLKMESGDIDHRLVVFNDVVHIDNVKGSANGDGSFENPFNSFASCIANSTLTARCGSSGSVIYVAAGGKSSTTTPYDTTGLFMRNNQKLFGRGFKLFGFGGDAFPSVYAAGNTVTLANNNEIAGLQFDGAGQNAIYGFNVTGFNIHNNRIQNSGFHGIHIRTEARAAYGDQDTSGVIADNVIRSNGWNGIYLENYGDEGFTATQKVTITNNTIINSGWNGIAAINYADDEGTATQTLRIENNTISNNGFNGVYADNGADDDGTATQKLTITGNTINNNNYNGIELNNYAGDGATSFQRAVITNNTISNNGFNGIYAENEAYYFGTATQRLIISDNTINGNDWNGVYLANAADYFGTANQHTTLTNNTISNNGFNGVQVYQEVDDDGTALQRVTLEGNTINNNGWNGVYVAQDVDDDGTTGTQKIVLTNNTISNNGFNGIYAYNEVDDEGIGIQTLTLTGNTITDNGQNGIRAKNYGDDDGTAIQTIDLSGGGNIISNNTDYGVYVSNYNNSTGNVIQTIDLSGGNTFKGNGAGTLGIGQNDAVQKIIGP